MEKEVYWRLGCTSYLQVLKDLHGTTMKEQLISVSKRPKRTILTTSYFNEIKDIPANSIALITYGGQSSED